MLVEKVQVLASEDLGDLEKVDRFERVGIRRVGLGVELL